MGKKPDLIKSIEVIKRLYGNSPEERLLHRLHCIALVMDGHTAVDVARIFGDSPRAVAYWVTRYKKSGMDGLLDEDRPGRPSRLSPSQQKRVANFVQKSQSVTGNTLAAYIKKTFGVKFTIRQCWRILKATRKSELSS